MNKLIHVFSKIFLRKSPKTAGFQKQLQPPINTSALCFQFFPSIINWTFIILSVNNKPSTFHHKKYRHSYPSTLVLLKLAYSASTISTIWQMDVFHQHPPYGCVWNWYPKVSLGTLMHHWILYYEGFRKCGYHQSSSIFVEDFPWNKPSGGFLSHGGTPSHRPSQWDFPL